MTSSRVSGCGSIPGTIIHLDIDPAVGMSFANSAEINLSINKGRLTRRRGRRRTRVSAGGSIDRFERERARAGEGEREIMGRRDAADGVGRRPPDLHQSLIRKQSGIHVISRYYGSRFGRSFLPFRRLELLHDSLHANDAEQQREMKLKWEAAKKRAPACCFPVCFMFGNIYV